MANSELSIKFNQNLRAQIHAAAVQAVTEVFEGPILSDAKASSPVRTGANRDSIRVKVFDNAEKGTVTGIIFTTSGYGWLIERGSQHRQGAGGKFLKREGRKAQGPIVTPARPYIFPALMRGAKLIAERARQILASGQTKAA